MLLTMVHHFHQMLQWYTLLIRRDVACTLPLQALTSLCALVLERVVWSLSGPSESEPSSAPPDVLSLPQRRLKVRQVFQIPLYILMYSISPTFLVRLVS
jgi:hypothetical protein